MFTSVFFRIALVAATVAVLPVVALADVQTGNAHEPAYTTDGRIVPPTDYR